MDMCHFRPGKTSSADLRVHHRSTIGWPAWLASLSSQASLASLAGQPVLASLAGQPGWPDLPGRQAWPACICYGVPLT